MRTISNREEANNFYQEINNFIDIYLDEHKINPESLQKYFKNVSNKNSFLKHCGFEDVKGIKVILDDVVEDRVHMKKDGVMKFEHFNENIKDIVEDKSIKYEKILADRYGCSISHVLLKNKSLNKFLINDFGTKKWVIIYSEADIQKFKHISIEKLLKDISNKTISLKDFHIGLSNEIILNDILDDHKLANLLDNILVNKVLINMVTISISDESFGYKYKENYKGYYIWEYAGKNKKAARS